MAGVLEELLHKLREEKRVRENMVRAARRDVYQLEKEIELLEELQRASS